MQYVKDKLIKMIQAGLDLEGKGQTFDQYKKEINDLRDATFKRKKTS